MEPEHFVGRVSVRALIENDAKVFVCRGVGDTVWQLPDCRHVVDEFLK